MDDRPALLVVRRVWFEAFASGAKTVEYRRHRPPFTDRVFYPGRPVRIAYNYRLAVTPVLFAVVTRFEVARMRDYPQLAAIWPEAAPEAELALIHLHVALP
jgi:hypothetical protein